MSHWPFFTPALLFWKPKISSFLHDFLNMKREKRFSRFHGFVFLTLFKGIKSLWTVFNWLHYFLWRSCNLRKEEGVVFFLHLAHVTSLHSHLKASVHFFFTLHDSCNNPVYSYFSVPLVLRVSPSLLLAHLSLVLYRQQCADLKSVQTFVLASHIVGNGMTNLSGLFNRPFWPTKTGGISVSTVLRGMLGSSCLDVRSIE